MEPRKRKKLSGSQNRKRKAAREEALKKQAGALYSYIKKAITASEHTQPEDIQLDTSTSDHSQLGETQESTSTMEDSPMKETLLGKSTSEYYHLEEDQAGTSGTSQDLDVLVICKEERNDQCDYEPSEKSNFPPSSSPPSSLQAHDLEDPAKWPKMTNKLRRILTELGPVQKIQVIYPKDSSKRKFSNAYYNRKLGNGELVPRPWLVYSESKDCVFCFCCKLFSDSKDSASFVLTGYNRWKHLSTALQTHETSLSHLKRLKMWREFQKNLRNKTTLDCQNQPLFELERKHWSDVMARLIEIIKYLGSQCLALRGSTDDPFQNNNGHFLPLIDLFGKFDPVIASHIERTLQSESNFHYFGENIQKEIIDLLGRAITEKIVASVIEAKYFSIILDCTTDIGLTEQTAVVIRFVSFKEKLVLVEEHFLCFLEADDSGDKGLRDNILSTLSTWNLDIDNIRGQSYDHRADTRGKRIGLQNFILTKNQRAFYVPCAAQSLNFFLSDAAKVSDETISFFATVQKMFTFLSASEVFWGVLEKHISSLTLKPDSETKWICCIDALQTLRYQSGEIYDSLFEIVSDEKFDMDSKCQALFFCRSLKDFQFLCTLVLWHDLLSHINPVSEMLEQAGGNISIALTAIDGLRAFVSDYRTEASYRSLIETSKQLCQDLDGDPQFKAEDNVCCRKKASVFEDEHKDESPKAPEDAFRVNVFNALLDVVMSSLKERCELLQQHTNRFKFLYDINKVTEQDNKTLKRQCVNLENHLSGGDKTDISGKELFNELCVFRDLFPSELQNLTNPYDTIQFIHSNDLPLPNLKIALRILLTLPASVAGGGKSFSTLKLIKNYLRSRISQEGFTNLAMISIEHDVCAQLQTKELISKYWIQTLEKGAFL